MFTSLNSALILALVTTSAGTSHVSTGRHLRHAPKAARYLQHAFPPSDSDAKVFLGEVLPEPPGVVHLGGLDWGAIDMPPPPDSAVQQDVETIRGRRLSSITAGITNASHIPGWLVTLGADGRWPATEIDYTSGCDARRANWPAQEHWRRILTMAAAWHGHLPKAESYTGNATLLGAVSNAMDWWFRNDFTNDFCLASGGTSLCPCGTPGLWNTNWYSNVILIPALVGQSCLLIGDSLTSAQVTHATHITARSYGAFDRHINGLGYLTGANTLDVAKIGIDQGLLTNNASLIADAYRRIHKEVIIQDAMKADGIRPDGSFGQHGGIIYNGNYGKDYINDVLDVELDAAKTQFSAKHDSKTAFATLMGGSQWMIYRNVATDVLHWDFSVLGRFISFPVADGQATKSIKFNLTDVQKLGKGWGSDILASVYDGLSQKTTNANVGHLNGNRMFYNNDYMVHRGQGYVTTLKMYSNRTKNTECVNSQNPLGFHLSDGVLYTYLQGGEYEDIAASWDWNLIPGITVDHGATPLSCTHTEHTGIESFVGGVSDGKIGAAVMRYTNPYTRALSWQKAWFFLDDDVQHVMISNIKATTHNSVFTVLDQKKHNGAIIIDGFDVLDSADLRGVQTMWHDSVGYVFDTDTNPDLQLSVKSGPRSGNWSAIGTSAAGVSTVDLFTAWIDHGLSGKDLTSTAYTILPATDLSSFQNKRAVTQVKTLQNDASISAVYDNKHHTVIMVFWNEDGGTARFSPSPLDAPMTITANGNIVVIYRLDEQVITVADPSQTLTTVQINLSVGPKGAKPKLWGSASSKRMEVTLPRGGSAGSSVTRSLPD